MLRTLELKHIAPYLPHNVQFISKTQNYPFNGTIEDLFITKDGYTNDILSTEITISDLKKELSDRNSSLGSYQILLRPLNLTKPITHNGETFVPIERLWKLYYPYCNHIPEFDITTLVSVNQNTYISIKDKSTGNNLYFCMSEIDLNPYWAINKLHEWLFDTDNLIRDDLAKPIVEKKIRRRKNQCSKT